MKHLLCHSLVLLDFGQQSKQQPVVELKPVAKKECKYYFKQK
jgi:hypothetical protein